MPNILLRCGCRGAGKSPGNNLDLHVPQSQPTKTAKERNPLYLTLRQCQSHVSGKKVLFLFSALWEKKEVIPVS